MKIIISKILCFIKNSMTINMTITGKNTIADILVIIDNARASPEKIKVDIFFFQNYKV